MTLLISAANDGVAFVLGDRRMTRPTGGPKDESPWQWVLSVKQAPVARTDWPDATLEQPGSRVRDRCRGTDRLAAATHPTLIGDNPCGSQRQVAMKMPEVSEADQHYLQRVVEDCEQLLGPGIELAGLELDANADVVLRLRIDWDRRSGRARATGRR